MTRFHLLTFATVLGLAYLVFSLAYFATFPLWRSLDFLIFPGQIERALAAYSQADIAAHLRAVRLWDMIFPAYYGAVITLLVRRYWQGKARVWMLGLLWVAVAADYVENFYTIRLLTGQGGVWPHVIATWVKFWAVSLPMNLGIIRLWREWRESVPPKI